MSNHLIPNVIESASRGERVSDVYSRLLSERIVFLGTPIDHGVANVVSPRCCTWPRRGPRTSSST